MMNSSTESSGTMTTLCGLTLLVAVLATTSACSERQRTTPPSDAPAAASAAQVTEAAPSASASSASSASSPASVATSALTLVTDRSLVCMVNNQFMGLPQIPIEVAGRTYYGCCEMCKGRLGNDPSSRTATDPVSQRSIDKATAVIGKTNDGRVLYFENDQTFAAFTRRASP